MKNPKTVEERLSEVIGIRKKLDDLGLSPDHPQVKSLIGVLNDFVRGEGFTGTVSLSDFGRVALAKLALRRGVDSEVTLRAIKP